MRTVNPKMYILAGVLAILVLALSGCAAPAAPAAPAAEATATEAAAEATATEAAATEAAAEATATEAAAEAPAADASAPVKVALVYGVKGDGFYVTMEKGARAKAEELGVDFSADGPAQFDATLQRPILDAVVAQQPVGALHRRHRQAGADSSPSRQPQKPASTSSPSTPTSATPAATTPPAT